MQFKGIGITNQHFEFILFEYVIQVLDIITAL